MNDSTVLLASGIEPIAQRSANGWTPPKVQDLRTMFPQLEILNLIGHGGMGAVYRARQTHLDRFVAVKILSSERSADPTFAERFTREARALARLQHAHIVTLYDFGQANSRLYLVMEYVEGANLRQLMNTGRMDPLMALGFVAPLCDALAHAHAQGVVHRDLKPENILIDAQGQPKIADFGLAKLHSIQSDLTQTGDTLGTLHYMSPEQISGGGKIDHRADVYALGVIFYEMLTGNLPLGRCLPPSQSGSDPQLDEVVLKSLEREPDKRWQSVDELRRAVADIQARLPVTAPTTLAQSRTAKFGWLLIASAACVIMMVIFILFSSGLKHKATGVISQTSTLSADSRYPDALNKVKEMERLLASMELQKSELEHKIKELNNRKSQSEIDAQRALAKLENANQQQVELARELEELSKQRAENIELVALTNQLDIQTKAKDALLKDLETLRANLTAKELAATQQQEQADNLANELTARLPGPASAAPVQLNYRYDNNALATIGSVVLADGTQADLPAVPWPREGAKFLVSVAKEKIDRQYADLVRTHQQITVTRQRLIRELLTQAVELARLDVKQRHRDLQAQVTQLGQEIP